MNLFILRHGIAEELGPQNDFKDAQRALTNEGEEKLRRIAKAMERMGIGFDAILASPYVRAQQTAKVVGESLKGHHPVHTLKELSPDGSSTSSVAALRELKSGGDSVLLVGHEPNLSTLISLLAFGDRAGCVVLKKGGLCKLSVSSLRHGRCAVLEWLLTPKQMLLMS